jgi:hypothetical protein
LGDGRASEPLTVKVGPEYNAGMAEHERRVATNEAIFRATNERLGAINEAFAVVTENMSLVCECGNIDCMERLTLGVGEYEALRGEATRFGVLPARVWQRRIDRQPD